MTESVRDFLYSQITESGMWENEAKMIMDEVEASPTNKAMVGRWNDDIDDYPQVMKSVLMISVKTVAVEWIDQHKPQHFARSLFVLGDDR